MNKIVQEYFPIFEMYQDLRRQLMEILTNDDLRFTLPGENLTLGGLCREIGEVEVAYTNAFKEWKQDFSYRHPDPNVVEQDVAKLTAWFDELDRDLKQTIEGLSDEELISKVVERGPAFKLPPQINLTVYTEALLIFYGKVSVYLKAMEKERPQQWQEWIG